MNNSSNIKAKDEQTDAVKVPPHSIEAEQAVLGALMLDNNAWDKIIDQVSENDFYQQNHRLIFKALSELAYRSSPFDVLTISEMLKQRNQLEEIGGELYLFELAKNTPSAINITAYAKIVRERSILRQLISVSHEIAQTAFQPGSRESHDLLDEAEQRVFKIAEQHSRGNEAQHIKPVLTSTLERIDHLFQSKELISGVPTGYKEFDEITSGLQAGDLIIIAGRPSMGKTAFAMNIVEHVLLKHQKPSLVFSMEMSNESLVMRLLSSLGRINQHKI
jgi:replicative DNA helicase